jgi:hypothetical protein
MSINKEEIISTLSSALDIIDWMAYEMCLESEDHKVREVEKELKRIIKELEE